MVVYYTITEVYILLLQGVIYSSKKVYYTTDTNNVVYYIDVIVTKYTIQIRMYTRLIVYDDPQNNLWSSTRHSSRFPLS